MPKETAQARAVRSFFAGGISQAGAVAICRGLSCELNGAAALQEQLAATGPTVRVDCFGLCDHSPALRTREGEVLSGAAALAFAGCAASTRFDEPAGIRCLARRPIVTERIMRGSHHDLAVARRAGVYSALAKALQAAPGSVLAMIERSGEQGRGGAGYPTAAKWRACLAAADPRRFVVANGDEGDAGSFIDRVLLEEDPHAVLEGMALSALAVGASEGVVFIRAEYPRAQARMNRAIAEAREAGLLGPAVLGHGFAFDVRVVGGHGSYVCGEETALLNAIENKRGEVRVRPPYPTQAGLYGQPTVVNNIETLVNVPWIVREGPEAYRSLGVAAAPGTKAFCLARGFARPGIVEAEFGLELRGLIEQHAGGGRNGQPLAAVALGGPMGSILTPAEWDVPLEPAALGQRGIRLGHAGLVPIPEAADLRALLLNWAQFMALESCGKCVPCSLGSRRAVELVGRIDQGNHDEWQREFTQLLATIEGTSLCGFGQGLPQPLLKLATLARAQVAGGQLHG